MITVITGLPGNGKTLYAIASIMAQAAKEGRTVYYSGIADLRVPGWIEVPDATKWADKDSSGANVLPAKSILIVDEAQRIFRPRMHGANTPSFVAALETHRHMGVDLVLVTQHPMLIDSNVRRLCGRHLHVVRKFGTKSATIHEWPRIKETCDKNREDSSSHPFAYPAEVFALYKSAEAHTHKMRIPWRLVLLFMLPLVLIALAYVAWNRLAPRAPGGEQLHDRPAKSGSGLARGAAVALTPEEYVSQFQPRVQGLPHTAPIYDDVTKVTVAPYPAACVAAVDRCQCYTEQGTRVDVTPGVCAQIVERGFFVAWKVVSASPAQAPVDQGSRAGPGRIGDGGAWPPSFQELDAGAAVAVVPRQPVRRVVRSASAPS